MLASIWHALSRAGTKGLSDDLLKKHIFLTNQITLSLGPFHLFIYLFIFLSIPAGATNNNSSHFF